jgi:hypothetical protein
MDSKYGRLFTEEDVQRIIDYSHGTGIDTPAEIVERLELGDHPVTFPADEPLFLLRAQDEAAPRAIAMCGRFEDGNYVHHAGEVGASTAHLQPAADAALRMVEWQEANPDRVKVPDATVIVKGTGVGPSTMPPRVG